MEAERWLRQARKDLESAWDSLKTRHYEWACFQSQQAAEKALKGFLYAQGVRAIVTHSVRDLLLECSKFIADFSSVITEGKGLTATIYRPGIPMVWWAGKYRLSTTPRRMQTRA